MLVARYADWIKGRLSGLCAVALLGTALLASTAPAQCQRCGRCGGLRAPSKLPTPASSEAGVKGHEVHAADMPSAADCPDGERCARLRSLLTPRGALGSCAAGVSGGDAQYCGMPAPEYPVPIPTPSPAVWTQLTYPPLMPHNSLPHYRGTYSYRHAPGLSRTNVHWYAPPVLSGLAKLHNLIELPR